MLLPGCFSKLTAQGSFEWPLYNHHSKSNYDQNNHLYVLLRDNSERRHARRALVSSGREGHANKWLKTGHLVDVYLDQLSYMDISRPLRARTDIL